MPTVIAISLSKYSHIIIIIIDDEYNKDEEYHEDAENYDCDDFSRVSYNGTLDKDGLENNRIKKFLQDPPPVI